MSRGRRRAQPVFNDDEDYDQPSPPRRTNNTEDKTFPCPGSCGKIYGSVSAWHTHFNNKHRDSVPPDPQAQWIHDEFYRRL
jgi:hypothetical protein